MIGSHDTFTYLPPKFSFFKLFRRLWQTQCKSISEQYGFGVRFFDIRVVRHGNYWIPAHGICDFSIFKAEKISDICDYMGKFFPEAIYRIVLERGSSKAERLFKEQVSQTDCSRLWMADIKHNRIWRGQVLNHSTELYLNYPFARTSCTWVEPCKELHGQITVHNILKADLREDAKEINESLGMDDPMTLQEMKKSTTELYFLDYCTNEF